MNKIIKKGFAFAVAVAASVALIGTSVYALDSDIDTDSSGNVFGAGQTVDISKLADAVENELFAAGMTVSANDMDIDGSAFVAGQDVTMKNTTVGASVFAAGNSVIIDAKARNNIWIAGNIITLGKGSSVKGLHVAGNAITVEGTYEDVSIAGNSVVFDAEVTGNVKIEAEEVTFGDNAKIGGDLTVTAANNPEAAGVAEGKYTYEENTKADADGDSKEGIGGKTAAAAGAAAAGAIVLKKIKRAFLGLFKYALFAVVLAFVFKKNLKDAYDYATKKPGMLWGLGAIVLISFPLFAIIAAITIIGLPVAGFATTIYVLALAFAKVFTFASLVRELIFTHTSKRLNPVLETVLAVLPAPILKEIPVVGFILSLACAIYTIGYVVLAFADTVQSEKQTA